MKYKRSKNRAHQFLRVAILRTRAKTVRNAAHLGTVFVTVFHNLS